MVYNIGYIETIHFLKLLTVILKFYYRRYPHIQRTLTADRCVHILVRPFLIASLYMATLGTVSITLLCEPGRKSRQHNYRDWKAKCDVTQKWNEFSKRFDEINQSALLNNYCTPLPTCHLRGRHFAASVSTARLNPNCFPEIDYGV